jgi:hypothetical protein
LGGLHLRKKLSDELSDLIKERLPPAMVISNLLESRCSSSRSIPAKQT